MGKIIEQLKNNKVLLSDGAWGTMLQSSGLKTGDCPELWNRTHGDEVLKIARSYIDAGSDMIETNSFGGSEVKLSHYNLQTECYELNKSAAEISREAAGDKLVLGSVGPTGKFLMMGEITPKEMFDSFKTQIMGLRDGGADAICIETFYALDEAELAVKAAQEVCDLDIIVTFTFEIAAEGTYTTMMGVTPLQMMETFIPLGVDILGTNCGNGFKGMIDIIKQQREYNSTLPLLVHANAGIPVIENGSMIYPDTPKIMAELLPDLVTAGANIVGGCCGTTPKHISEMRIVIDELNKRY